MLVGCHGKACYILHATYLAHKYPDDQEPSEDDDKYIETLQECYNECEISCEAYLKKVVPDCDETVERSKLFLRQQYRKRNMQI